MWSITLCFLFNTSFFSASHITSSERESTKYIIKKSDCVVCFVSRGSIITWLRSLRLEADWCQAEKGEDDEGDDDEGQLKPREGQFHLHTYTAQIES